MHPGAARQNAAWDDSGNGGGAVTLAFALRDGRTRLADLGQQTPLRVLFPTPPPDDIPTAAIMNTGGGLVAGDRIDVAVEVRPGAKALVMAGAAEKVYRSTGPTTRIEAALRVAPGAWLEWLPQETILFAESRLARRLRLDVAADGRATAGEILVLGRLARGERARSGLVRDAIEVRRDGRLAWADALHLEGDYGPVLDSRSGFGGALAVATFLHVAPDAARHLEAARAILAASGACADADDPEVADVEFPGIILDGPVTRRPGGTAADNPAGYRPGPTIGRHPDHPPDRHPADRHADRHAAGLVPGSPSGIGGADGLGAPDGLAGRYGLGSRQGLGGVFVPGGLVGRSDLDDLRDLGGPGTAAGPAASAPYIMNVASLPGADPGLRAGVTCVNGVLVARWLAHDPRRLRASFGAFWAGMRNELAGLPAKLPRLWEV